MNHSLLTVVLLLMSFNCFSSHCIQRQDTLYYIEIEVRGSSYPVIMAGVMKNPDFISLSKENQEAFFKSFYRVSSYVPDLNKGYENMIIHCMGEPEGVDYLDVHKSEGRKMMDQLTANSITGNFTLDSGENVTVSLVQISGIFWFVNKSSKGLKSSSNEIPIDKIQEIRDVYVPFEIQSYKKPPRKMIKKVLL